MPRKTDKMFASFNIEFEVRAAFEAKAHENGTNAFALLKQCVVAYLDEDIDRASPPQQTVDKDVLLEAVGEAIRECLPAAIKERLGKDKRDEPTPATRTSSPTSQRESKFSERKLAVKIGNLDLQLRLALIDTNYLKSKN